MKTETTYRKLRDGTWGICGPDLKEGHKVVVRKKGGDTKEEYVGRVLWRGEDGVCIATVKTAAPFPRRKDKNAGGAVCAECGRGGALVQDLEDGLMKHRGCCDIEP